MTDAFERLSAIKPYKSVQFNLDRTLKVPKRVISDRALIKKIKECAVEFKRDGASHSWSTFRIDGVVDATMNDSNAALMLSQLGNKKYFFRVKFIIRVEDSDWIIRDKFEPILKDKKTVTVSRDSKPGLLTGIDKPYYERAYPETAVVYGIYPLNEKPDIGKVKPMKQSPLPFHGG